MKPIRFTFKRISSLILTGSLLVLMSSCAGLQFTMEEITDVAESEVSSVTSSESTTSITTSTEASESSAEQSESSETEESTSFTTTPETSKATTTATPTKTVSTTKATVAPTTTKAPTAAPTTKAPAPTTTKAVVSPDGRQGAQLDTPFVKNGVIVINKNHWVSRNYRPLPDSQQNVSLVEPAWSAFKKMRADAEALGMPLDIRSSYRSYDLQESLFAKRVEQWGEAAANRATARPGESEHQSGLAIDVSSEGVSGQAFANHRAGIWLRENSYKYGFILRFPQGKEHITGYVFEPWHFRYVGEAVAADFGPNSSLTLEEYLGVN